MVNADTAYQSLLPPNSTALERALEKVARNALDIPIIIKQLHNPDTCPVELLPWLAWSLSVDEWDKDWSEQHQRQTIKDSRRIHREKGTNASIRRILASIGFHNIRIVAGLDAGFHNGAIRYDGSHFHGDDINYGTKYRIYLDTAITVQQATQVRRILEHTAPARCYLQGLHYDQVQATYNAAIKYDGTYHYGVA